MCKSKRILIILFSFIFAILCMTTICNASVKVTSCDVTTPAGIYGVGKEIDITIKFDKKIKGTISNLKLFFGGINTDEYRIAEGKVYEDFIDTITYKYIIQSGDNGKIDIAGFESTLLVETEETEKDYISFDYTQTNIYADTTIARSNPSGFKAFGASSGNTNTSLEININNGTIINDNYFYVYLTHNKDEKNTELGFLNWKANKDGNSWQENSSLRSMDQGNMNFYCTGIDELFAESGNVYIWICEEDKTHHVPKIIVNGEKVERPTQLPVGSRMEAYLFSDETSTFCYETYGENERKIKLKVGTISDVSILKAIRDGESECLNKLLEYAKSADSIYTGTVKLGKDSEITSSMDLVKDGYYYVYMQMDDENGKYYPIEDVSLYQALVGESVGKNLFDYLSDEFKWNIAEEPEVKEPEKQTDTPKEPAKQTDTPKETKKENDTTTAPKVLPKTGKTEIAVIMILLCTSLVIAYIKTKKYKRI